MRNIGNMKEYAFIKNAKDTRDPDYVPSLDNNSTEAREELLSYTTPEVQQSVTSDDNNNKVSDLECKLNISTMADTMINAAVEDALWTGIATFGNPNLASAGVAGLLAIPDAYKLASVEKDLCRQGRTAEFEPVIRTPDLTKISFFATEEELTDKFCSISSSLNRIGEAIQSTAISGFVSGAILGGISGGPAGILPGLGVGFFGGAVTGALAGTVKESITQLQCHNKKTMGELQENQKQQAQQNLAENFVMQRAANLHLNTASQQNIINNTACFKAPFQPRQSSTPNYVEKNCGGSCDSTSLGMSEFWHTLEYTNLIPSYNNYNHASRMYCPANSHGNIGGVATQVATITDLIDSEAHALADEYYLCFPAEKLDFPDWMLQQAQQELSDAFFKHKTLPFFSLHFNQTGFLYPIIHPAYQNTLIGEVIGLLDYWMKGYLNGGIFDAEFLKQWHETANCDDAYLRKAMIDLKQYCKQQQESLGYLSLRELASRYGNKDKVQHTKSAYRQPFQTSFRIIAYQDKVERHANILMPHADFKIESSVELMPDYQQYVEAHIQEHGTKPPEYQQSLECYELFAAEIKENMPKLPFCRDYFKLLGFVNSLCYFYTTLDKMGKKPIINNEFILKTYTFPKSLPPIPIRYYTTHQLPITLEAILNNLTDTHEKTVELDQTLFSLFAMKKIKALPEPLLKEINLVADRLVLQGLHDKIAAEELSTLNPDEMVRITTEISNVFLILSSQYANEVHRALNRILKMFKLELSQQQVQGLTNLVLTDKIQQIQKLFANHLQVILSRWEGNPAVVKTELFTETQKDLHAALQGKINKIEEFEAQELRRNLAAELASHDAYTNGVIAKFNVDNKELLTATTDSLEQQKIAETAQEIASIKALIQKQATEEQNKLLANKQQLESNLQILEGNITYLQKNKAEQLASVPAHLRAANQANIDKFIIEEDAKIAAQQVNIDNFREMLVKTNNILATVLADADALIQTKIQKITENKQAIFDEKINNLAALKNKIEDLEKFKTTRAAERASKVISMDANMQTTIQDSIYNTAKRVLTVIYYEYSKQFSNCLNRVQKFSQILLSLENIEKQNISKLTITDKYTHTCVSFTEENNSGVNNDSLRIVGGCEMSLPNIISQPIPNGALFRQDLRQAIEKSDNMQDKITFEHSGSNLVAYRVFVDALTLDTDANQQTIANQFGYTQLHIASQTGNIPEVNQILDKTPELLDTKNARDVTPLMLAIQFNQQELIEVLYARGANFNHCLPNGLFALYFAIQRNFIDLAVWIVENVHDLNVNLELDSKETSLHLAIQNAAINLSLCLLNKGAKWDLPRKSDGFTALHCAAVLGNVELLTAMLAKGAMVDLALESNKTPLHLAAESGCLAVVEYLVRQNASLNATTLTNNENPLMLAIQAGQVEIAKFLAQITPVNLINKQQQTASLLAEQYNMSIVADYLIRRGENPNLLDSKGVSYIYYLIRNNEVFRVSALIEQGLINVNQIIQGNSLLGLAAKFGRFLIAYNLLDLEASYQSSAGLSLMHYVVMADEIMYLRDNMHAVSKPAALVAYAVTSGATRCLELLLKTKSIQEQEIYNLLPSGIAGNNQKIICMLLKYCTNLDRILDKAGNTALHVAAKHGSLVTIQLLMERGCILNILNNENQTAFHIALQNEDASLLKKLFKLSRPTDWPVNLWQSTASKSNTALQKVMSKYQSEIPNQTLLSTPTAADTVRLDIKLQVVAPPACPILEKEERILLEEFQQHCKYADFSAAEVLMHRHPILQDVLKSEMGGELLQKIISNVACVPSKYRLANSQVTVLENNNPADLAKHQRNLVCDLETGQFLSSLNSAGINPAIHLGKNNLLLTTINAKNDAEACYRLEVINKYFAASVPILAQDQYIPEVTVAKLALKQNKVQLFDKLDVLRKQQSATDRNQFNGLHEAIEADCFTLVVSLLKSYSVDTVNSKQQTPLMLAVAKNNLPIINLLLQKGAILDCKDLEGRNALHYAVSNSSIEAALIILPLLKKPNEPNRNNVTTLMQAAAKGLIPVMHYLCERGNNIKLFDKDGRNALHYAALAGQVKGIRYLVEHGFNIDELEARGGSNNKAKIRCTALQLAALQAKEDAVFCLLELNANPDLTDSRGFALCEYAICSKNKEMLDLIKLLPAYHNRERDKFLLHAAVQVDNVVALSELILDKINVNTVDTEGRSVLHLACLYNAGNTADLLLNGGDLVLDARDQFGYMPLHYAARFGHVRLIELLILAGANINGKNRENCTALHLACEHNQIGAATSLLKFKADLDITNSEGFTAQQIAKDKNHTDIQEILNQENYIGNILNMHWLYSNKTNSKNLIDQTIVQQQEQKVCNLMKL